MFNELYCFSVPENLFINKKVRKYSAPNYISMLNELKEEHYLTGEKIAFVLDIQGGSTVTAWADGSIPEYVHGDLFIDLWKTMTNKSDDQIPRIVRFN